jgi:hypothetical protein
MPMSRGRLAVALTALLTVVLLLSLVPAQAHTASASPAAAPVRAAASHPSASITYTTLNGFGYAETVYFPGELGWGAFAFIVADTLDHAVNVTLTDPNAVKDGVATPAYHYEATLNTTTHTFNSYTAGVTYTFPDTLTYPGPWVVNFSAPNGGYVTTNVSILLYYVHTSTSAGSSAMLPGQALSVFWWIYLDSNGVGLYTHATQVWMTATYTGNGTVQSLFPQGRIALTPASAGEGQWNGMIPLNTTPNTELTFDVYAITNVTSQVLENASEAAVVTVGHLVIRDYGITQAPPTCAFGNAYYFPTGSLLASCLLVESDYLGAYTPVSGLPVTVGYWNGTAHVTPTGAPTALTTNTNGEVSFTFPATSPPFSQDYQYPGYDALNFTVKLPGASSLYVWTVWLNATWTLEGGSNAAGIVHVTLDHTQYYQGATATATWSIATANLTKTGTISAVSYLVEGPNGMIYQAAPLNHTATNGTFAIPITAAMVGHTITVYVYAENATRGFYGYASAAVISPLLLLSPAYAYYSAGTTMSVTATLNGGVNAIISYQLWGYWQTSNSFLSNGTVANGTNIHVTIPATTPPLEIVVSAWATVQGQVVATATADLFLAQGYSILLGVTTPSSYSDGSYQPGQTITLSYQVVSVGGAALPQYVTFDLFALGYPQVYSIPNANLTGTLSFTIPSNAVQGTLVIELDAIGAFSAGSCFPTGSCVGLATIPINPSPSALALELGGGVTVGWLILLVLLIVVAVVLFVVFRRRGRRATPPSSGTLNPPAPAPSVPPAAEWQGPTQTPPPTSEPAPSSSQPPLPEPPAGSP